MFLGSQRSFDMQQTVRLLGDLGERYGAEHQYHNLRSPSEAIKLLCINYPALQKELTYAHEQGVGYKVIQAGLELDYDDLALPLGQNDLIVTPVVAGSGGGAGKILAGVGLIAAAVFLGPTALGGAGFLGAQAGIAAGSTGIGLIGSAAASAIGAIGASLVLGGVSEIISPQPQLPSFDGGMQRFGGGATGPTAQTNGVTGGESYAFNGPANVAGVGTVIPVAYGNVIIGSRLLSARLEVTNEGSDPEASNPLNRSVINPSPQTIRLNNFQLTTSFTDLGNNSKAALNEDLVTVFNQTDSMKLFDKELAMASGSESGALFLPRHNDNDDIDIIFRLQKGIYDRVSGAQSSKVEGSFTYQIEIYSGELRSERISHRSQTTIQGLLNATDPNASEATRATQKFRWLQRCRHSNRDDGAYIVIKILNFDIFTGDDGSPAPTLKIHAIGVDIPGTV